MKMKIKDALKNEDISYRDFYAALQMLGIGYWDGVNSTEIIEQYVRDMMKDGIRVSHILAALEDNESEFDDWRIWLGNSMNTPIPINSKEDLIEALELEDEDLEADIEIE